MKITNVVYSAHLGCPMDLVRLCQSLWNCRYDPKTFPALIWHHRLIGGNCLVFVNGVINCNGKATSFEKGRQRIRKYARKLQTLGYSVRLRDAKIITVSASHTLSAGLDLISLAQDRTLLNEPELFPAINFKKHSVNFCCFHTGKVIITGIKTTAQIYNVIYPTLIELELYTRKNK